MTLSDSASWFKRVLWPIEKHETPKVLYMFSLIFLIMFNYSILRICKDTLIVNAHQSGAEALPFIKIWGVTPVAFLLTSIYIKLVKTFTREHVFYIVIGFFITYFLIFSIFLFPNLESIHPNGMADSLMLVMPKGLHGLIAIIRNWSISLFYILAELWSSFIMGLLFWGFANDTTKMGDAKRYYFIFALSGHTSFLFSGKLVVYLVGQFSDFTSVHSLHQLMNYLCIAVFLSGIFSMFIFRHILKTFFNGPEENERILRASPIKKKKMGLIQGLKYVARSNILRNLAFMVCAYGFTIALIEISWKNQVKEYMPNTFEYLKFMGKLQIYMGYASVLLMILSNPILKKWGWCKTALITPFIMLFSGLFFFILIMAKNYSLITGPILYSLSPLALTAWLGFWQNISSKGAKNSVFLVTKEMVYIPLDNDTRVQGKAAIDVLGERLGKLGGSAVSMTLLIFFSNVSATAPGAGLITLIVSILWVMATISLRKELNKNNIKI